MELEAAQNISYFWFIVNEKTISKYGRRSSCAGRKLDNTRVLDLKI